MWYIEKQMNAVKKESTFSVLLQTENLRRQAESAFMQSEKRSSLWSGKTELCLISQ